MPRLKKVLLWTFVAFVLYAIFTSPDQAAGIARDAGSILAEGVRSIGRFFNALLNG